MSAIKAKSSRSPAASVDLNINFFILLIGDNDLGSGSCNRTLILRKIDGQSADKLLTDNKLSIKRDGSIQVCYAPFDHIEQSARLVIVGITPGMTQSVIALNALHDAKIAGKPIVEALRTAK
ncbi:hypothetical protein HGG76_27305 [Ochrobactrum tritici]|uniref:Uncharacterized protein n=1 Tax=Brucella tritici TaxID=94626 RepID=A0A7X6JDM5_9HYPH|nr:hypothetical protein [Brucella tritici]